MAQQTLDQKPQLTWMTLTLRFIIIGILMGAFLFIPAGRLDWQTGWVFLITLVVLTFSGRAIIMQRNPDLLAERAKVTSHEDAEKWDKILMPLVGIVLPLLLFMVAGLDERFGWSPAIPLWLQGVSWALYIVSIMLGNWAMIVNRFFSATVRIQTDRNQEVITDGPYQFVRHPGYLAGIITNISTPFLLGALWALIPALISCALIVVRTVAEDHTLQAQLPGYTDYTAQTRYRLFPGIW